MTSTARRCRAVLAPVLLLAALAVGCSSDDEAVPTNSSCADAALAVGRTAQEAADATGRPMADPLHVKAGETLHVSGVRIFDECDGGGDGEPLQGVRLFAVQGAQEVSVARVNAAGPDASFTVEFGVPPNFVPGLAALVVRGADSDEDVVPVAAAFEVDPA